MIQGNASQLSYKKGRFCLFCKAPIADQEHGLRLFCPTKTNLGFRQSCKDEYHSEKWRAENGPFIEYGMFQKLMFEKLTLLYNTHGENVTLEMINSCGIQLIRPIEWHISESGLRTMFFHEYSI